MRFTEDIWLPVTGDKTVTNVYIKSEENKAFYVADGEDGFVELWD